MATKLTYFNLTGLGEPVRLMLSLANIPFQDVRISKEEWDQLKPKLKWPHLPMLEMDGKVMFQAMSICRHIARKIDLAGTDEEELTLADMTVAALEDMRLKVIQHYFTLDSPERIRSLADAKEKIVPLYMKNFEEQLTENEGFLVKGKLSWADIIFACHADYMNHILQDNMLAEFPNCEEHLRKVMQLPGIKEWIESRPDLPSDLRKAF